MFTDFTITTLSSASVLLVPVFALQGAYVRKRTPKIPGAAGNGVGMVAGNGEPLHLLLLGESTIAGVGAPTYEQALAGQTAHHLAHLTQRCIHWRAIGKNGATVEKAIAHLVPQIPTQPFDAVVIALGVNDVLHFHPPNRYQRGLRLLIQQIRHQIGPAPVVLSAVPEVGRFPILPQPLRVGLGLRAHAYNLAMQKLAITLPHVAHAKTQFTGGMELLCEDRFHPSPLGYQQWGEQMAHVLAQMVR